MSTASNPPDIETRTRTVQLAGHPDVVYEVTLVKPASRAWDAWAVVEVTIRSVGGMPVTGHDLVPVDHLRAAALNGIDRAGPESPSAAMRELSWLPPRCQRVLHRRGVTTNALLFSMSESELRTIRGLGAKAIALIDARRPRPAQP
ncbi:hypothetical protein IU501_33085 [Nocardia otitidiscaviarum]|uniref:hypothetical protein n=1 Tax=Nocardia otitidiscaviarum TaxID=1823 RepID=UPI0004A75FC4|nr:hypothetical protein [Nocardia otitidiscaviarum]MBF6137807.1 hypothetical protein [Nocardia otitidiscaviarum]MBF6485330.1 hypothetical protein [Nocardia otitidiscaviarum]